MSQTSSQTLSENGLSTEFSTRFATKFTAVFPFDDRAPTAYSNAVPIVGYILTILIAYLLGSIPTGFLVAKARGVDIRTVGSGNIGATNVFRILGKPAGIFVLLADALKGWLAVFVVAPLVAGWCFPDASALSREWFALCAGIAAILGHNYTCWLYFKGGKGIATSAGALVALVPLPLLIILGVWILVFACTRYVSLASICAASTLPFAAWAVGDSLNIILVTAALAALAVFKHRANIKRLVNGTENRIGGRPRIQPDAPKASS
jgi:glycerol-3-phosphate acyltransferase PlsY